MKRINIILDDQEERILNAIIKKYGGKPAGILKDALKAKYDKAFPNYAVKEKELLETIFPPGVLSNEQICEMKGGKVVGDQCEVPYMNSKAYVALTLMGQNTKLGDFRV